MLSQCRSTAADGVLGCLWQRNYAGLPVGVWLMSAATDITERAMKILFPVAIIAVAGLAACTVKSPARADNSTPVFADKAWIVRQPDQYKKGLDQCFAQYPVPIDRIRRTPPLVFADSTDRFPEEVKSAVVSSYRQDRQIDFAGHFKVVAAGCGTSCQYHVLINLKTGVVNGLPFTTSLGIGYRAGSRLLVKEVGLLKHGTLREVPMYQDLKVEYYLLKANGLVRVPSRALPSFCR